MVEVVKKCPKCGVSKPIDDYYKSAYSSDGHGWECKSCASERGRQYRLKTRVHSKVCELCGAEFEVTNGKVKFCTVCREHPNRQRKYSLKHAYGVSWSQYQGLLNRAEGLCESCGAVPDGKALCVDHDHSSGAIRGLLCDACNLTLGASKEDVGRLEALIVYLRECQPETPDFPGKDGWKKEGRQRLV